MCADLESFLHSVERSSLTSWEDLRQLLLEVHCLPPHTDIALSYSLPGALDLLPISSDEELTAALLTAVPLLRVFVHQRSSEVTVEVGACCVSGLMCHCLSIAMDFL